MSKLLKLVVSFTVFMLVSGPLYGAQTLNLEKCVEEALKNNPAVKAAQEKLYSAKAKKDEAYAGYLPVLTGNFILMAKNEDEVSPALANMIEALPKSLIYSFAGSVYTSRLSLTQPVFMWGKIGNLNKLASNNYCAAEQELLKARAAVEFSVKEAFFKYILAVKMHQISSEAYNVANEHLKVLEGFFKEGKAASYDVSRTKVAAANAYTNLIRAKNGVSISKQVLINTLNIQNGDVEFSGGLEYVPLGYDEEKLLAGALANRPEIKQLDFQGLMLADNVNIVSAGNKPNIVVTGQYQWQNTELQIDGWYASWNAAAVISVPIFDGFAVQNRVKQAKADRNQALISREALCDAVKLEVKAAFLNFTQARESIEANKGNVQLAKDNLDTALERYKTGMMSEIELRDAQFALTQAETTYYQALCDYLVAAAQLKKAAVIFE